MSEQASSTQFDLDEIRTWLEEMVRSMQFVRLVAAVLALVTRLRDMNTELTKQLANLRRARPRSERLSCLRGQLSLPWTMSADSKQRSNDREGLPKTGNEQPREPRPKKSRKGIHPGRNALPDDLERVPEYNGVPTAQRQCPKCGMTMKRLGHTHCEYLEVVPARVVVIHRSDEAVKCALHGIIASAPPPPRIVERGVLGNRLIIEATCDKFLEHQPVERQVLRFRRLGVDIAPQTLGRAVSKHLDLLKPIAEAIAEKTRGPGLLATDATGIPVLDPDSPEGIRFGTMWAWTNAYWVTFFYTPVGDSDSVRRFLEGPEGNEDSSAYGRDVQADGTNILSFIERAGGKRPGCWSHARRGLVKCARGGDRVACDGVEMMAPLFKIEKEAKEAGDNAEERKARRQKHSKPIVDEIEKWVREQSALAPPKTELGKALGYLKRQWKRLVFFLDDGNIPLTNNRRERELRKLVLGRRNWLFVWKDFGGERTANILTIVASCVSFGINPREYLVVVTQALLQGGKEVADLLPDRIGLSHPELLVPNFEAEELPD